MVTALRATAPGSTLTAREIEVLELVRQRLTNAEIAEQLYVSVRTVEAHVSALLRKLAVEDRRALAQLAPPGGSEPAAAPRSLPSPLTPFVGRIAELAELSAAVQEHRLVVATGPGGVGKTRLALATAHVVADTFADGCVFVDLVKVTQPAMVVAAIADACGAPERSAAMREETLVASLSDRQCLVIIDNCEHVQDAARVCIERLLSACPSIRILATSRLRLMLPFERVYPVPGMSLADADSADDPGRAGRSDAVTLFVERMVAAGAPPPSQPAELATVHDICHALDGMALAIELAAARAPSLGLDGLLAGLGSRLRILAVGSRAEDRHRSLRAAIDWTYDLLTAPDQQTLRAAAVFAAPFGLDALCSVTQALPAVVLDSLARLVDWNLVALRPTPSQRYRVLETIRQYAFELPEFADEEHDLRDHHAEWCRTSLADLLARAPGDDDWCVEVDALLDDARSALAHQQGEATARGAAAAFAGLLADVAFQRGRPAEAQRCYEDAAALAGTPMERRLWLHVAAGAAAARNVGGDTVDLLIESAAIAEAHGQFDDAATDLAMAASLQHRAQGIIHRRVVDEDVDELLRAARAMCRGEARAEAAIAVAAGWGPKALARSHEHTDIALRLAGTAGQPLLLDEALDQLTALQLDGGDLAAALATIERRLAVLATVPVHARSGFEHYDARHMACQVTLAMGLLAESRHHADSITALPFFRQERHLGLGRRLGVDAMVGDFDAAVLHAELFEQDWRQAGRPVAGNLAVGAYAAAMVFGFLGQETNRTRWIEITRSLLQPRPERLDAPENIWASLFDGMLALHRGEADRAAELLSIVPDPDAARGHVFHPLWLPWYAAAWAEAAVLTAHPDVDERLRQATDAARVNEIASALVERAAALHRGRADDLDAIAARLSALGCPYQADRTLALRDRR